MIRVCIPGFIILVFLSKNENTTSKMAHTLVSQELEMEFSKTESY
jgi:hypothetical protein